MPSSWQHRGRRPGVVTPIRTASHTALRAIKADGYPGAMLITR